MGTEGQLPAPWRRILVPVRGGHDAEVRARLAMRLALDAGARVTALYVVDAGLLSDGDAGLVREQVQEQLVQEGQAVLEVVARAAGEAGVVCDRRLEVGPVVGTIARVAREEACDLIVVGAHRHTWLSRLLGGGVAEVLLASAPCAVLAVPPAAGEKADRA
jgi:nucleotide-binding universal stress UspA family protein